MRKILFLFLCCFLSIMVVAQTDTANKATMAPVFERILTSMRTFKPDTTAPPNDKFTQKILELRNLRGGFNIYEAIDFKLEEDRQKGEMSPAQMEGLTQFFKAGSGKRWLDHAVIWIYRQHFTYSEVKGLVKFYKTSAGQKMADQFPMVMLQTLAAAEMLKNGFMEGGNGKEGALKGF